MRQKFQKFNLQRFNSRGISLIDVVIVIIIAGILAAVSLRSVANLSDTARVEEAKQELDEIELAIVGNPKLYSNNTRGNFGYVGDVGSMPANLDALYSNPGGYATWKGPYVNRRLEQDPTDYKVDPWGTNYAYTGGITVTSSGSGSNIVKKFGEATSDFLSNGVDGIVLDLNGTPPGAIYNDSVSVRLRIPNGSGNYTTLSTMPDNSGYFSLNSVPIGNHDLTIIYTPTTDTLKRFVSVLPKSRPYGEYRLPADVWYDTTTSGGGGGPTGSITYVANSDTTFSSCANLRFWITNNSGSSATLTSFRISWSAPTAYYEKVKWNGNQVADLMPRAASGQTVNFSSSQTLNNGSSAKIELETFKDDPTSGNSVNMNNVNFTVTFSDSSNFSFLANFCN